MVNVGRLSSLILEKRDSICLGLGDIKFRVSSRLLYTSSVVAVELHYIQYGVQGSRVKRSPTVHFFR